MDLDTSALLETVAAGEHPATALEHMEDHLEGAARPKPAAPARASERVPT